LIKLRHAKRLCRDEREGCEDEDEKSAEEVFHQTIFLDDAISPPPRSSEH
jgi:hypothetical protein